MLELNRAERRSLLYATALVVAGTAARLGLAPGPAAHRWMPADPSAVAAGEVRRAAAGNLRRARRAGRPLAPGERIDPNTAPPVELDRLPGVGPVLARAIVRERARGGPFRARESLLRVSGVGHARLRRMAPHLDLPAGPPPSPGPGVAGGQGPALDLNRATREELAALPGLGPALAARIVELRARKGGFARLEELREVRGVGPARMRRLQGLVRVGR